MTNYENSDICNIINKLLNSATCKFKLLKLDVNCSGTYYKILLHRPV